MNQAQAGGETIMYALLGVFGLLILFTVMVKLGKKLFSGPSKDDLKIQEEIARAELEARPKCVCGELATEPMPMLKRSRGALDWLRSVFAAPPRYKRMIDRMQPPAICRYHADSADAMLDEWIFKTRARYADLNTKTAIEAASFEQEALAAQLSNSLTELQKRATRKPTAQNLRVLPAVRNGTDGEISQ
jgi:hypothetical protein